MKELTKEELELYIEDEQRRSNETDDEYLKFLLEVRLNMFQNLLNELEQKDD